MTSTDKTRGELLEVSDVMALYHVTRRTVYRWIESGRLKGKKAGRRWLFTHEAVIGLLK